VKKFRGDALWNIFYDPVLAAIARGLIQAPPINFQNPAVTKMWEGDLQYIRKLYFQHRQYWKINGKPVLYIWNIPALSGADDAFAKARKSGIYLLGDALHSQVNSFLYLDSLPPMDCITGFLVVIDALAFAEKTIGEVVSMFSALYNDWNRETEKRNMGFMPAGSCQYDDTEFAALIAKAPTRILAKNRSEVEDYLAAALAEAKEVGGTRYIFWGTSNNWAEGTTLLPTKLVPASQQFYVNKVFKGKRVRRIGEYGFEHLNAVKTILFPAEQAYSGPVITSSKPVLIRSAANEKVYRVKVILADCDVMGTLALSKTSQVTVLNSPDFKTLTNIVERSEFRYEWNAEVSIDLTRKSGSPATLWVKFKNLDTKSTSHPIVFNP
jgi:hypothetical protein